MAKQDESEKRAKETPRADRTEEQVRRNLIRFIGEADYSVTYVATLAGLSQATLTRYISGENAVAISALSALAEVFGRTANDFYSPNPPPFDASKLPLGHFRARPDVQLTDEDIADIEELNRRMIARREKKQPPKKK